MTLYKEIVRGSAPTTKEEIINLFKNEGIEGKTLISFEVKLDNWRSQGDPYTCYYCVDANYYDIIAEFA